MSQTQIVLSTLTYVERLSGTTVLIKLGGASLEHPESSASILKDIRHLRAVGISVVLVHGGGPSINQELTSRGISWEFIDGQRVTTPDMMEVIETVLFGKVNRRIVRALNQAGVPAVGLSGVEAATLRCRPASPKLGQVGEIETVNASFITALLRAPTPDNRGAIPVIAPIGVGGLGETFNINADWAASRIAQALGIKKVIYLTDQDGILDAAGKVISELDASELDSLVESGGVTGGMLTKTRTILEALRNGIELVHVLNGRRPHALVEELFSEGGVGTLCSLRARPSKGDEGEGKGV